MKDPVAVLRAKEQDVLRIKKEIEALRAVIPLLREEGDAVPEDKEKKAELRRVLPMP
jgi:hypothetical protein